jgi:hypothetical protein
MGLHLLAFSGENQRIRKTIYMKIRKELKEGLIVLKWKWLHQEAHTTLIHLNT